MKKFLPLFDADIFIIFAWSINLLLLSLLIIYHKNALKPFFVILLIPRHEIPAITINSNEFFELSSEHLLTYLFTGSCFGLFQADIFMLFTLPVNFFLFLLIIFDAAQTIPIYSSKYCFQNIYLQVCSIKVFFLCFKQTSS